MQMVGGAFFSAVRRRAGTMSSRGMACCCHWQWPLRGAKPEAGDPKGELLLSAASRPSPAAVQSPRSALSRPFAYAAACGSEERPQRDALIKLRYAVLFGAGDDLVG